MRRTIGMVFQRPNPFPKSIYDNVAWGCSVLGMKDNLDERVERALTQAALWDEVKDRLKASALSLSGGQQQRLCIARAIAVEPDVVLMDEPASALDPIATQAIEQLMHDLKSEYSFVIVTHNMQQAARVADMTAFFSISTGERGRALGRAVEYDAHDEDLHAPVRQADGGLRHRPLRLEAPRPPERREERVGQPLDDARRARDQRTQKPADDERAREADEEPGSDVARVVRADEQPPDRDDEGGAEEDRAGERVEEQDGERDRERGARVVARERRVARVAPRVRLR